MTELEIQSLIADILTGDRQKYAVLVNQYRHLVFSLCLKMLKNQEDAEEVAQDTFVKAFQQLKSFRGEAKFSTWLFKIAYFSSINFLRKRKRLRTESLKTTETNGEDYSIFMELAEEERKYYLDLAFTYLTPVERGTISLYYFDENSMEEVAQITGQSLSNTKVIVHRTRKKLNEILNVLLKNKANILLEI